MAKELINIIDPSTGKVKQVENGSFTMENSEDGEKLTIHIDGYIGWWHNKSELRYYLHSTEAKEVYFKITSEGGDPRHSTAMKNYVEQMKREKGFKVFTDITGFAASSATHFALCGDERRILSNSAVLYHEPTFVLQGKLDSLENQIESFKTVQDLIINDYMKVCKKTKEEMVAMFKKDAWISPEMALEFGFVTEIVEPENMASSAEMNISTDKLQQITMLGLPPIHSLNNKLQMENIKKQLVEKHGFTMAALEGKDEAALKALLIEKEVSSNPEPETLVMKAKNIIKKVTGNDDSDVSEQLKAALQREKDAKEAYTMLENTVKNFIPQAPPTPGSKTQNLDMNGNTIQVGAPTSQVLMYAGAAGKESIGFYDGKAFGLVSMSKPKLKDQSNLHPIEMLYFAPQQNNVSAAAQLIMAGSAFDLTQLNAELGAASIQVMEDIIYEKQRVDDITSNFTLVQGIKDKRKHIEGFTSPVSQPFSAKPVIGSSQIDWQVYDLEVQGAVAAIQLNAYDLAKTYFGRLQRPGYDPYNYPAILMIWEMLADRIMADVSKIMINGERDASVAGTIAATLPNAYLKSFDGFNKIWDDILANGTGGVTAVVTGTIFGTDAYVINVGNQMALAIAEEYRNDEMVCYCSETWAKRYYKALLATYPNQVPWNLTQGIIPEGLKIEGTNITLKPLKGFSGSERLVVMPQTEAIVAMDLFDDLNKMYVRDVALCQEVYVPYQAKSNVRRISPNYLAINNQS